MEDDWRLRHCSLGTFSSSVASGSWEDTDVYEFGTFLYPTTSSVTAGSAHDSCPPLGWYSSLAGAKQCLARSVG